MKCPLYFIGRTAVIPREGADIGECLGEQCAWWIGDVRMCAIRELALETRHIQFRLQDLERK